MKKFDVIFQSDNIDYIKLSTDLVDDYLIMVNDMSSQKFITKEPKEYTYEDEYNWVMSKLEDNSYVYSMVERNTNKFIGNIELMHIEGKSAELGVMITKEYQDKHYGTECIKRMIDYAFNELGFEELRAIIFSNNKRSLRCCEKRGFTIIDTIKNVCVIDNEEVDDIHLKLRREI